MRPQLATLFLLIDALKRLYAAEFKGTRTQQRAVKEYDEVRASVEAAMPRDYDRYVILFGLAPDHTGTTILRDGA
jgi:hypothetical protein